MTEQPKPPTDPDETPDVPASSSDANSVSAPGWEGPTYYGRSQLKAAPFNNWVVGGYIFLAGLSGASALIAATANLASGEATKSATRRGRYMALLAPTVGSALLVYDLHTPQRFYNMFRVAKGTSPMSIGTWILISFTGFAGLTAAAQFFADRFPRVGWFGKLARASQLPAALTGAGLSTYTASLLSATSTPLWAAAPKALAMRFGASSVASGASALALGERSRSVRWRLDALTVAALAAELAATNAAHEQYRRTEVDAALQSGWGRTDRFAATGLGTVAPLVVHAALSLLDRDRTSRAATLARCAVLAGSALLRVSVMGAGDVSASRPDISFRFSQPKNLPPERVAR